MRKQKTISFLERDREAYEWLTQHDNASRYVVRLIKKDMENAEKIAKLIEQSETKPRRMSASSLASLK